MTKPNLNLLNEMALDICKMDLKEAGLQAVYKNQYDFAQYLAYTLCPDIKEAGQIETAKDIRKAAVIIEKLVMELRHYRGGV
jgi:hypothetical protein